jgi:hypothetical protein
MNSTETQQKLDYLQSIGYGVKQYDITATVTATNAFTGVAIWLNSEVMQIQAGKDYHELKGWIKLDLDAFKILCVAFGITHMTAEERRHAIQLLSHYATQFLNHIS